MGSHFLTILLCSVISPSITRTQTTSNSMNDVSSLADLLVTVPLTPHNIIQSSPSDLISEEPLSPESPLGLSKSEALSTNDETVSNTSEKVLVGNQNIDEVSTTFQTTQGLSDMTAKITDGGHNNILGASEHNVSTESSTMADRKSTTKAETSPANDFSSSTSTIHHDQNDTSTEGKATTKHGMTNNDNPFTDKDKQTSKYITTKSQKDDDKKLGQVILIGVIIIILILLSIIMIILVIRKKRRSGSQSFHTPSRRGNRQDVWAGQVPETGDGKMFQDPVGMENGATGNQQEPDKEMTTFVNGDKKVDSVVEMEEISPVNSVTMNGVEKLVQEENLDEKRPLLEGSSEGAEDVEEAPKENQFPAPPMEQDLL